MVRRFDWITSLTMLVDWLLNFPGTGKIISMVDAPTSVSVACGTIVWR